MAASEGREVRQAYDGPDFDHDKLINFILRRNEEDAERASSAGESRQEIGEFVEETGINAKALSVSRMILKQKKQEKALDIIRSLEKALPMVKAHLNGQQSEMDLEPSDPPEPVDIDELPEAPVLSRQSYDEDFDPTGDDEIDGETDAFEKHLADVAEAAE